MKRGRPLDTIPRPGLYDGRRSFHESFHPARPDRRRPGPQLARRYDFHSQEQNRRRHRRFGLGQIALSSSTPCTPRPSASSSRRSAPSSGAACPSSAGPTWTRSATSRPVIVIDQKPSGPEPALDRRHGHRALHLSPAPLLAVRRAARIGDSIDFSFNNPPGCAPAAAAWGGSSVFDVDALVDWDKSLNEGAIRHRHFNEGKWLWKVVRYCGLFDLNKPLRNFTRPGTGPAALLRKDAPQGSRGQQVLQHPLRRHRHRHQAQDVGPRRGRSRRAVHEMQYFRFVPCTECGGSRLNAQARSVKVRGRRIHELVGHRADRSRRRSWAGYAGRWPTPISGRMKELLGHLVDIGHRLHVPESTRDRLCPAASLSGVKMARQLGCDLVDLIYVLDEPSIGLHQRDIAHLLDVLQTTCGTRATASSSSSTTRPSSRAPTRSSTSARAPGRAGGRITFEGTVDALRKSGSVTGRCLRRATEKRPEASRPSRRPHHVRTPGSTI